MQCPVVRTGYDDLRQTAGTIRTDIYLYDIGLSQKKERTYPYVD